MADTSKQNLTARQIYQKYKTQYDGLVNTYCQVKKANPLASFPKLAAEIRKAGKNLETWDLVVKTFDKSRRKI